MISFRRFVDAIHDAILEANDALMDKNTGLLDKFFKRDGEDPQELQSKLNDALRASRNISDKKGSVTREDFKAATDALDSASKALSGGDDSASSADRPGKLVPRTVVVEYPRQTENGIEKVDVEVPLITLSPISMSHIEKATLTANFEMEIVDDELQLNFTNRERAPLGKRSRTTRGKLEITIAPSETSEGLKQLVEGYEKVLKAQIPH